MTNKGLLYFTIKTYNKKRKTKGAKNEQPRIQRSRKNDLS